MIKFAALVALFAILATSAPASIVLEPTEGWNASAQITGQSGPECHDFQFQEDAQGFLERNDWIALRLDQDGDGIACNELQTKADVLPPMLLDSMMLEMGSSSNFPQISFDYDLEAYLAGFVHEWDVEDVEGVRCPELSAGEAFQKLIPWNSIVFLQDQNGHVPVENPDANYMNPTWIDSALLWVWDGISEPKLVNSWLIQNGYGVYSPETTPPEWKARFELNDQTARHNKLGVWGECKYPEPMLASFEPTFEPPPSTIVTSVSGDWSKSANFNVPADGTYGVTVACPGPSCYIEVKTLQHLATGQEFPELYFLLFGPDQHYTEMYLPAGTYLLQVEGVGGWRFTVDSSL